MNVGYPLLCEQAVVSIPSSRVTPRDARAAEGLDRWDKVESPTPGFKEQCYFHQFEQQGKASVYNPEKKVGLEISFDTEELPLFTEWGYGIMFWVWNRVIAILMDAISCVRKEICPL